MKSEIRLFVALLLVSTAGFPVLAEAVSFSPIAAEHEEKAAQGIMEKGALVCLFESGTADVKKAISIGDVLVVYREGPKRELKEVGKIKVLSYAGADYLKGVLVEGEIMVGDIAKKGEVATLVVSSGDTCNVLR